MFKGYFSTLISISNELHWNELDFIEEELENQYKTFNQPNELRRSKLFSCFMIITYISVLFLNLKLNNYNLTRSAYVFIGAFISEIILVFISHFHKIDFKLFYNIKLIRYLLIYICGLIILIFPASEISIDLFFRTMYFVLVLLTINYIYFIHYNLIIMVSIPIVNSVVIVWLQYSFFADQKLFLLPEFLTNLIFHICTFIIKRNETLTKKETFYKSFENQNYIKYVNELVDMLNTMVISVKGSEIFFMNECAINYFEEINKYENFDFNSSIIEKNDLVIKGNRIKESLINLAKSFFNSLTLNHDYHKIAINNSENVTLYEILNQNSFKDLINNNSFVNIGIFSYKLPKQEKFFEVYARKVKINDELVELLIYDISIIKTVEKAKAETKYKQKILAKIAHEFKTPLITIITLIQSFDNNEFKYDLESSIKKKLSHVVNLSNYTIFLIQDIIQYVSEINQMKIAISNVNLKDILNFCNEVLQTLIDCNENKYNKIETFLHYDANINDITILSNENRLKQILLNFISNSVKFTASGSIKINADVNYESSTVIISVDDTGIGIKNQHFPFIFQDVIQLNLENDYNDKGSGLGLSMCKLLAESLGHELRFESNYGEGTKFFLTLKFKNSILNIDKRNEFEKENKIHRFNHNFSNLSSFMMKDKLPETGINEISLRLNNKNPINEQDDKSTERKYFDLLKYKNIDELLKDEDGNFYITNYNFNIVGNKSLYSENCIVVIDDHKLVRLNTINLIKTILYNLNISDYCIIEGSDGIDLLNLIRKDEYCKIKCIFTDENMEYINGSEAVKIIRKLEQNNKIKSQHIVSVTAFDDISSKQYIMSSGVNSILSKPCSKNAFLEILKETIK